MVAQHGPCIIGGGDWAWQLDALAAMRPSVVKVQVHNVNIRERWGCWYSAAMLDQVVANLAPGGTLILRTAETRIGRDDLAYWLDATLPGGGTLRGWIAAHAGRVIVEVGNEPDRPDGGRAFDAWQYRHLLLRAAAYLRATLPGVPLCASLATHAGSNRGEWDEPYRHLADYPDDQYNRVILDAGAARSEVADAYDYLGVHGYGTLSFSRDEGAAVWGVFDLAAQCGKPILWTEAGLSAPAPWREKVRHYRAFLAALPAQVEAVCWFCLDALGWREPHYALGVNPDGTRDLATLAALGEPLAGAGGAGEVAPAPTVVPPEPVVTTPVGATTTPAGGGGGGMLFGIDAASHQGRIDWRQLRAEGHEFAIVKVTGEGNYVNPYWYDQREGARAAGLVPGTYDWVEPQRAGVLPGPLAAADYLRAVGRRQPGDLLAVDFETPEWAEGVLGRNIEPFMRAYLYTLKELAGQPVIVYTARYYLDETGASGWDWLGRDFVLWQAAPGRDAMLPDDAPWPGTPAPWRETIIHQHQWHARSVAIVGEFDRNRFRGARGDLARLGYRDAGGGEVREPVAGKYTAYINEAGETIVALNFGGQTARIDGVRIVDVGVSVESQTEPGKLLDRSFQNEAAQPWRGRE